MLRQGPRGKAQLLRIQEKSLQFAVNRSIFIYLYYFCVAEGNLVNDVQNTEQVTGLKTFVWLRLL